MDIGKIPENSFSESLNKKLNFDISTITTRRKK